MIMRTSMDNKAYHIDCFRCEMCNKQLRKGDEYSLCDEKIVCRMDYEKLSVNRKSNRFGHGLTATGDQTIYSLFQVNLKKHNGDKKTQKAHVVNNSNSSFNSNPSKLCEVWSRC
jgi:hypothetical protein